MSSYGTLYRKNKLTQQEMIMELAEWRKGDNSPEGCQFQTPSEVETMIDDMRVFIKELKKENATSDQEIVKLKEENRINAKMIWHLPNDMDIFSWDKKREMWRHDEDGVSDEEEEDDQ